LKQYDLLTSFTLAGFPSPWRMAAITHLQTIMAPPSPNCRRLFHSYLGHLTNSSDFTMPFGKIFRARSRPFRSHLGLRLGTERLRSSEWRCLSPITIEPIRQKPLSHPSRRVLLWFWSEVRQRNMDCKSYIMKAFSMNRAIPTDITSTNLPDEMSQNS
jgi:hypothetical protein